ncbi:MAG TPA: TA system VapC family ribonuclease toxin [Terriglobales bacterium]|nr:TA system VapC family ribonuclease toxin [Terriglobales bacterium]
MVDLLDVNVWVALSAPGHRHHHRAKQYWSAEAGSGLLFCRATAMALLRLLSHEQVMGSASLSGGEAWHALEIWLSVPSVHMATEPDGLEVVLQAWAGLLNLRGRQWPDAYLAAFAISGGYRLVTFDSDFRRFPHLHWLHLA